MPDSSDPAKIPLTENSEYCGPDQLCRVLMMLRRWDKSPEHQGAVSDVGLRRLLDLAFQVSLTTEEGRHPRFRMFASAASLASRVPPVVRFEPALRLEDSLLRRLAPSLASRGHALRVIEHDRVLWTDGIVGVSEVAEPVAPGSMDITPDAGLSGLMVRVDGPGILRVTEKSTWELRAGRIQPVRPYGEVSIVRRWFEDLAVSFLEQTSTVIDVNLDGIYDRGDASTVFDSVWSFVLSTTLQALHGGAFVVVPGRAENAPVHVTYRADQLDLMKAALHFWNCCYSPGSVKDGADAERRARAWESARRRMFSAARALADLSNTDGCVVLDRRLRLSGFGGEIRVPESSVAGFRVFLAHPDTLAEQEPVEIERFGTRHRSAARLCAAVPGTLAFVISQDGDLRVFYGLPDLRVCMWRNLGAWLGAAERW